MRISGEASQLSSVSILTTRCFQRKKGATLGSIILRRIQNLINNGGTIPLQKTRGNDTARGTERHWRWLSLPHSYGTKVVPIPFIGNIDCASCRFGIVSGGDQMESVRSPVVCEAGLAREEILHGEYPTGLLF
jgi:hypothetical protein